MSLNFNSAGSGRRVDCGSGSSLSNLTLASGGMSVWGWAVRRVNAANQFLVSKASTYAASWNVQVGNSGEVAFVVGRSGTGTLYESVTGVIALDVWTFIAATIDDSLSTEMDVYTGTLTSPVAEVSYGYTQNGSGTADDAGPLVIGNLGSSIANPFLGQIARLGVVNRRLTLEELRRIQYASMLSCNISGTKALYDLHGTGAQPDYSGNGNNGTVTSAVADAHVPLGFPFV